MHVSRVVVLAVSMLMFVSTVFADTKQFKQAVIAYAGGQYQQAFEMLNSLAESGHADSQYYVGLMYEFGQGVDANLNQSFHWYRKASDNNHAIAQYKLGEALSNGVGADLNPAQAVKWWKKSADNGYASAKIKLGWAYYNGVGVAQNRKKAFELLGGSIDALIEQPSIAGAVPVARNPESNTIEQSVVSTVVKTPRKSASSESKTAQAIDIAITKNQASTKLDKSSPSTQKTTPANEIAKSAEPEDIQFNETVLNKPRAAKIGQQPAKVFASNTGSSVQLMTLAPGASVEVLGESGNRYRTLIPGGVPVWVFGKYVSIQDNTGVITGNDVRARALPSTGPQAAVMGAFNKGSSMRVIGQSDGWVKVIAPERIAAWVAASDVVVSDAVADSANEGKSTKSEAADLVVARTTQPAQMITEVSLNDGVSKPKLEKKLTEKAPRPAKTGEQPVSVFASYQQGAGLITTLPPGSPLTVLGESSRRYQVLVAGGVPVWVSAKFISVENNVGTITGDGVRARALPSTAEESVPMGAFHKDDNVRVTDQQEDWVKVIAPERIAAWVPKTNVIMTDAAETSVLTEGAMQDGSTVEASDSAVAKITNTEESVASDEANPKKSESSLESSESQDTSDDTSPIRAALTSVDVAKVYAAGSANAFSIVELERGTPVEIVERHGDWLRVSIPGGLPLWVHGDYVSQGKRAGVINSEGVRARPMPSTDSRSTPVGAFNRGDAVRILERAEPWLKVLAPEWLTGWVSVDQVQPFDFVPAQWASDWTAYRSKMIDQITAASPVN